MKELHDDMETEVVFLPDDDLPYELVMFMGGTPTPAPEVPPIEVPGREDMPERVPPKGTSPGRLIGKPNLSLVKG